MTFRAYRWTCYLLSYVDQACAGNVDVEVGRGVKHVERSVFS